MQNQNSLPETGFVRLSQIIPKIIPIGKSSWWQGIKDGKYPQPVKLGERTTAWRVGDIKALIESYNDQGLQNKKGGCNE
jgi:predicted DNA-binding transcriptional regulator AlpA